MNIGGLVDKIKSLIESQIAPAFFAGIESTSKFFALVGIDPIAAAPHLLSAIATLFAIGIALLATFKLARLVNNFFGAIQQLAVWFGKGLASISDFATKELIKLLKSLVVALTQRSTYAGFSLWLGMLDRNTAKNLESSFKDGPTLVRYQRNLGFAVLAISIWSTLSFAYAVFLSSASFEQKPDGMILMLLLASILYGSIIFTFDRSIIAPFTPIDPTKLPPSASEVGLKAWISQSIVRAAEPCLRIGMRVAVAFFIAQFTAIPVTVFILHGGIMESIENEQAKKRDGVQKKMAEVMQNFGNANNTVRGSAACSAASLSLERYDNEILNAASSGCRPGWKTCPGEKTDKLMQQRVRYEQDKNSACSLSVAEVDSHKQEIDRLQQELNSIKPSRQPDILLGAKHLEKISKSDTSIYQPAKATFYLLFVVELIPVISKLLCAAYINRRRRADRRVSDRPGSDVPTEKRTLDRRRGGLVSA